MKRIIFLSVAVVLSQLFYARSGVYNLLVGTYTNTGKSLGIYSYHVDVKNGVFTSKSVATGVSNPSYLTFSPDGKYVYSVNEGEGGSAASAFRFNKSNGQLQFLNRSSTGGASPCYISATGKHVFTANYGGGSISVFGRNVDGSLSELLQKIQHTGKGIVSPQQNAPHMHQVLLSPDGKFLVANDLGTDKVTVYKYNPDARTEILVACDTLDVKLGSGPRHAVFSKDGRKLYVLQEIDGTVSVCDFKDGKLALLQETTVVTDKGLTNGAADIHLSPDGRFLYATNRGTSNSISCFQVKEDGTLRLLQQIPSGGKGPRNFAISPDGKYVFVAHQYTDDIVIFERDPKSGFLTDTQKWFNVGAPVCLKFY